MLSSLTGQIGFILTLNPDKKSQIPTGQATIEIPEPALAILFQVNNDTLFKFIQQKLPMLPKTEGNGFRKLTIQIPAPLPFPINPVIAQNEQYLIITSHSQMLDEMMDAYKNGNGLVAAPEFKRLSAKIPAKGNNFNFTSRRFSQHLKEIQKTVMKSSPGEAKQNEIQEKLMNLIWKENETFAVLQNTEEGIIIISNHNISFEYMTLIPVVAGVGIVSAIAIPNLLTAMQKGKQKATMGDMKSLAVAIESYTLDNGKAPEGKNLSELQQKLQPFYIKILPLKDGWGNDFTYHHGTGVNKTDYAIGTGGKDGVFDGWQQDGFYPVMSINDFNRDIIISNGQFILGPKVK